MEKEKNNKRLIIVLSILVLLLAVLCVLFATGTISLKSRETSNDINNQVLENNNNENNSIKSKLVDNLNCNNSETTFNGITVKVKQNIDDAVCVTTNVSINGADIQKDIGHAVDSYEIFDNIVIIMSHTTSGPIFTIHSVSSNSAILRLGSGSSSVEGYFVKSYSTKSYIFG